MRKLLLFLPLLILTSSCSIWLNTSRKTPVNPYKFPRFTEADSLRGTLNPYRNCFDVTWYALDIEIDPDRKFIEGQVGIRFHTLRELDTLQIDLYENMDISNITHGSDTLEYFRKYNAVFVVFGKTLPAGIDEMIEVIYSGKPEVAKKPPWEGGFVWKKDKSRLPWVGVACEVAGASLWWPVKDHLSDEPDSVRMRFTVPKGLFCVSNGRLTDRVAKGDKETFTWKVSYPINTYNVTVYVGDFEHFQVPYTSDSCVMDLDYYVLPYNQEKAKEHFMQTNDILAFFESVYGAYPWIDDGFKLVESPFEGMEHQTAIAYGHGYKNEYPGYFDYIILHETAHEWWGNSLSVADYAEIWLHEGFATYSEALYTEHIKGYEEYLRYLRVEALFIKNKKPLIGPYDVNFWDYKDGDVYMKGSLMLHTLRNSIANDTLFFNIIRTFYQEHKYSIATTNDFIALVNSETGFDYGWFFDQYLYSRVCPKLEYSYFRGENENEVILNYHWTNVNADFELPVEIRIDDQPHYIYPSPEVQAVKFSAPDGFYINANESYIAVEENIEL